MEQLLHSGISVILSYDTTSVDEGREMAQMVHSIAPDATIVFAGAGGPNGLAGPINALAARRRFLSITSWVVLTGIFDVIELCDALMPHNSGKGCPSIAPELLIRTALIGPYVTSCASATV